MHTYSDDMLRLAETTPVAIATGAVTTESANRLCGDRITLAVAWNGSSIKQIEWQVEGCVILKASAAYLARTLRNKEKAQAEILLAEFVESFQTPNAFTEGPMAPVYKLPPRFKCALLPWQACENLLRELKR